MNRPPTEPAPGTPGPRRPLPPLTLHAPQDRLHYRVPVAALKAMPRDKQSLRVAVPYFLLPADFLPNGLLRPTDVYAAAAFCFGCDFQGEAQIKQGTTRSGSQAWFLEMETCVWDIACGRRVQHQPDMVLAQAVFEAMSQQAIRYRARRYGQREGRN